VLLVEFLDLVSF
jgi:hypothetical protein